MGFVLQTIGLATLCGYACWLGYRIGVRRTIAQFRRSVESVPLEPQSALPPGRGIRLQTIRIGRSQE